MAHHPRQPRPARTGRRRDSFLAEQPDWKWRATSPLALPPPKVDVSPPPSPSLPYVSFCHIQLKSSVRSSLSGASFRDLPMFKRRANRRESRLQSGTPALREKPSKSSFSSSSSWGFASLKFLGPVLTVNTQDSCLSFDLDVSLLSAVDITLVDPSFLSRPNVLGIRLQDVLPSLQQPRFKFPQLTDDLLEPIACLAFDSPPSQHSLYVLLKCHARHEIVRPPSIRPQPVRETDFNDSDESYALRHRESTTLEERQQRARLRKGFRIARAVEIEIIESRPARLASPLQISKSLYQDDQLENSLSDLTLSRNFRPLNDLTHIPSPQPNKRASLPSAHSSVHSSPKPTEGGPPNTNQNERDMLHFLSEKDKPDSSKDVDVDTYCEVILQGHIVARTAVKKGTAYPFWNETFSFSALGPLTQPIILTIFQIRNARSTLFGYSTISPDSIRRGEPTDEWFPIYKASANDLSTSSSSSGLSSSLFTARQPGSDLEFVGDIHLTLRIDELSVLPSDEYDPLVALLVPESLSNIETTSSFSFESFCNQSQMSAPSLSADDDSKSASTAPDHISEFDATQVLFLYELLSSVKPDDHDRLYNVLVRIYSSLGIIPSLICQMASNEISGDEESAPIMFRGNSLLTKTLEIYLRQVGSAFLKASLGDTVKSICRESIDMEINPIRLQKLKPSLNSRDILRIQSENLKLLIRTTNAVWGQIYASRHRCPSVLRGIFKHIQLLVDQRYKEAISKTMRLTAVSAFIFLRFFVPALLNPKAFHLTTTYPDTNAQRCLTLVAKSLQGLANLSKFGSKEPWMTPMNSFWDDNAEAFVDYITHITTITLDPPKSDWTDPSYEMYKIPLAHRFVIAENLVKDSVPTIPHLIDHGRDLALFVSVLHRTQSEKVGGQIVPTIFSKATTSAKSGEDKKTSLIIDQSCKLHAESIYRARAAVRLSYAPPIPDLFPTNTVVTDTSLSPTRLPLGMKTSDLAKRSVSATTQTKPMPFSPKGRSTSMNANSSPSSTSHSQPESTVVVKTSSPDGNVSQLIRMKTSPSFRRGGESEPSTPIMAQSSRPQFSSNRSYRREKKTSSSSVGSSSWLAPSSPVMSTSSPSNSSDARSPRERPRGGIWSKSNASSSQQQDVSDDENVQQETWAEALLSSRPFDYAKPGGGIDSDIASLNDGSSDGHSMRASKDDDQRPSSSTSSVNGRRRMRRSQTLTHALSKVSPVPLKMIGIGGSRKGKSNGDLMVDDNSSPMPKSPGFKLSAKGKGVLQSSGGTLRERKKKEVSSSPEDQYFLSRLISRRRSLEDANSKWNEDSKGLGAVKDGDLASSPQSYNMSEPDSEMGYTSDIITGANSATSKTISYHHERHYSNLASLTKPIDGIHSMSPQKNHMGIAELQQSLSKELPKPP